ncbi:MAG: phosphate ABC transporter permease family protein [Reinekea sp.]
MLIILAVVGYFLGRKRSEVVAESVGGIKHLHSLPNYYGLMTAVWAGIPAALILFIWVAAENPVIQGVVFSSLPDHFHQLDTSKVNLMWSEIYNLRDGIIDQPSDPALFQAAKQLTSLETRSTMLKTLLVIVLSLLAGVAGWVMIKPAQRARNQFEVVVKGLLMASSLIAILTTVGIVFSVLFESIRFFHAIPITEFVFGTKWSPQIAINDVVVGSSGAFGAIPLFTGTLMIAGIALFISVPIGLMTAVYLVEYANTTLRNIVKPFWHGRRFIRECLGSRYCYGNHDHPFRVLIG